MKIGIFWSFGIRDFQGKSGYIMPTKLGLWPCLGKFPRMFYSARMDGQTNSDFSLGKSVPTFKNWHASFFAWEVLVSEEKCAIEFSFTWANKSWQGLVSRLQAVRMPAFLLKVQLAFPKPATQPHCSCSTQIIKRISWINRTANTGTHYRVLTVTVASQAHGEHATTSLHLKNNFVGVLNFENNPSYKPP